MAAFFILKRVSFVSAEAAQKLLRQGALVIDVRSHEEFQEGCLPGAINIPLGELRDGLPRRMKDKSQPLLLHCLSGGRSGIARGQLNRTVTHELASIFAVADNALFLNAHCPRNRTRWNDSSSSC